MSTWVYISASLLLTFVGVTLLFRGVNFGTIMLMFATVPIGVMVVDDLENRKESISEMVYNELENQENDEKIRGV